MSLPPAPLLLQHLAILLLAATASTGALIFPPTLVKQPAREQLFQVAQSPDETEKPFVLECEATGEPEPTYEWTKNGERLDHASQSDRISQQPRRGSLVFSSPNDADEGLYQCLATNPHGTAVSDPVSLRKAELGQFTEEPPKEVRVREGDPLTLRCDPPTGYPRPKVFWVIQHANGALRTLNSSRIAVDPEGALHFSNVEIDDAIPDAVYACSATSLFRSEYRLGNKILLKVESTPGTGKAEQPPIKQYVSPTEIVALRGRQLELHCVYGGTPVPQILWKKQGRDLSSQRVSYSNHARTLQLRSISFEDEGTYECEASNGVGVVHTHAMQVKVEAEPFWLQAPNDTIAAEGGSATFNCSALGVPEPELRWFMNGVPIEMTERNNHIRHGVDVSSLIIEPLTKTDTAVYQCNASNIHGYAFRNFFLNVAETPLIEEPPEPLTLGVVMSRATMRCRVSKNPRPEVKWMKESQEVTGDRYRILDSGDLQIDGLRFTDQGEYTCYASHKSRVAAASGSLEVKHKTRITQPPQDYEVAAGKAATFRCNAVADPTLELSVGWLFNDQPVDLEADPRVVQLHDNSLIITRTTKLDSGVYTCVARTEVDSDRAMATLIVQDVPNPPQVLQVECHNRDVLLEWKPTGDNRAPILQYSIQYNTSFNPDMWEDAFVIIPPTENKFVLSVTPWANYSFRVVARNKVGTSLPSEASTTCTTPEDVPYKNPDHVMGRGERFDNLVVTWTPMPPIEHNAPGFFYKILWKRHDIPGATWSERVIEDWKQNRLVVPDQPTFKPYRIKVEAYNRLGQANTAPMEVIGYSGENVPLAAPHDFTLTEVIGPSTAAFTWSPVSSESVRGQFRGYKIQTWTPDEGMERLREMVIPANENTAIVSLFRPFSRNVVRILAFNNIYNGPPSDTIEFTAPEGVPGPVASFEGIPIGSTAVYLTWKPPSEPNGLLTGYRIYYEEARGSMLGPKTERRPPVSDPQKLRAKLAGLKPRSKYRITIQASTYAGQGKPYFIELRTPDESENLPDAADFIWVYVPDDEDQRANVRVTWLPPVTGHPGSDFYVQYRRKGDQAWENTTVAEHEDSILVMGLDKHASYEVRIVVVDGKYQKHSQIEEVWTGTLDVPNPPEILRVECEAVMALVEWTPRGDNRASILSYSVQYSVTPNSWEDIAPVIPASDTSFRLALSPWANYTFRVVARNKVGPSAPSEPSATTCVTPESVPFKNPDSVTGRWNFFDDLVVSWMPMAPIDHNAPGFFYRVSWKQHDLPDAAWSSHDVKDWTQDRHVLRGLPRSSPYSVRVEAHNRLGQANVLAREIVVPKSEKAKLVDIMDALLAYF
ncbi:neuroglian-like [Dermacentor variabilis]|uniref:neuroglian-like n=1 Tax=Dermacentor variabilis TaxID=34621 RepID=UPI003F5BE693